MTSDDGRSFTSSSCGSCGRVSPSRLLSRLRPPVTLLFLLLLLLVSLSQSVRGQLLQNNEVFSVDLFTRENAKAHRTSAYEVVHSANPALVIRRGDPFYLALQLRKPYDPSRDKIRLEFMYGPRPLLGKKTLIYLPVTTNREFTKDSSRWDARTHRVDGNVITVQVHVPAHVAVGVWRLRVSTKQQGSRVIKSLDARERIYILFNAWCKEDPVYLDNEDRRREYVLNDIGKIYIGSHSKPKGRKWIYGQVSLFPSASRVATLAATLLPFRSGDDCELNRELNHELLQSALQVYDPHS